LSFDTFDQTLWLSIAGGLLLTAGVVLLRKRWLLKKRGGGLAYLVAGWLSVLAGFHVFGRAWGAEVGITYAAGALSVAAYALVAATHERRVSRERGPRESAFDPEERPTNWRRGVAKSLLAIMLAGIASIGVGVALAIYLPLPPADRAVIGGLLVPVLWGGGMAWTLSDPRLVRATIILLSVSALGYGIAFLPKVL
jgi:hypothetical protein